MTSFTRQLQSLDTTLFRAIESQTSENDRSSLLACQLAVRTLSPSYTYLEIGSHLGGTLQPHLLDEACAQIYSIDKRTAAQPDERGVSFEYPNNTTNRMLDHLAGVAPDSLKKLTCIDGDSSQVSKTAIGRRPQLCFIDAEHTDEAVLEDFRFCFECLGESGGIVFHDSEVIYNALAEIVEGLRGSKTNFHAYNLPDGVFVIEVGDYPMHATPRVQEMLLDNHVGYLAALRSTDRYRRFANRAPFRLLRRIKSNIPGWDE